MILGSGIGLSDPSWGITVQIPGLILKKGEKSINEQTNDPLQGKLLFKKLHFRIHCRGSDPSFLLSTKSHLYTTAAKEVQEDVLFKSGI